MRAKILNEGKNTHSSRRHHKTKFGGKFKSAYRKHKNHLQIGQNELKTIQSAKEMLRNDAKTMYLVYER